MADLKKREKHLTDGTLRRQEPFHRECFYVTGTWFTDDGNDSHKIKNSSKKNQETIINGIPEGYHRDC